MLPPDSTVTSVDALRTATSYFDADWNAFAQQKMVQCNGFPNRLLELVRIFMARLVMPKITYVHTAQRETIFILEALEKTVMPDKMKLILKARTQMLESIYKYFDLDLLESHRA